MAQSNKTIPLKCNLDLHPNYFDEFTARFIKNLTSYVGANNEIGSNTSGENIAMLKPLQSNEIYCNIALPDGYNLAIGAQGFPLVNRVYVFVYNSLGNHLIYRINGSDRSSEVVKVDTLFNFQLDPKYFIGEGQCHLEVNKFVNPDNGQDVIVEDLYWTDGNDYQGFLRVQNSIDTNGYDDQDYPYFIGNYDRRTLIRMGLPTPKNCISIAEIPHANSDLGLNNNLLFKSFQFRVSFIDVWGRQSEHGIISDLYIPGINDCISSSNNLARCLLLNIVVDNPIIDKIQIEYSNDNSQNWSIDSTISLYIGSNLGVWWLRARNKDIVFDSVTNTVSYTFCRNKECDPIDITETNTLQPGIAKQSQAIGKVGSKIGLANNKYGFNPFPQPLLDSIELTITPPDKNANSFRTIIIYVPIYNVFEQGSGSVLGRKFTSIYPKSPSQPTQGYAFGAQRTFTEAFGQGEDLLNLFQQQLPNQQTGIIGYLNDGSYAVSKQVVVNADGSISPDNEFTAISPTGLKYLQFTFTAKTPQVYIFRLASHLINMSGDMSNYQKTSTTIWGLCPFNKNNGVNSITTATRLNQAQELIIDVCNGDYNTLDKNEILVMADLTSYNGKSGSLGAGSESGANNAIAGYIYETSSTSDVGENILPIELAEVVVDGVPVSSYRNCVASDYNGFYWTIASSFESTISFYFSNQCAVSTTKLSENFKGMAGSTLPSTTSSTTIVLSNIAAFSQYFNDQLGSITYCNRILITGFIYLNNTSIGLPNVSVTLTRGQSTTTGANGEFTIIAHDDIVNYLLATRNDFLIIGSACGYASSTGSCLEPQPVTIQPCVSCGLYTQSNPREVLVDDLILSYLTIRGLLSGGTYGLSMNGYDYLGRKSFAQLLPYFTIPSIPQSEAIGASTLSLTIPPAAIFPDELSYITFSITAETTIDNYLDWIVDNVDFLDPAGNVTIPSSASQIKIYYGSVIEYNILNNYNTTVNWQFISSTTSNPVVSDKVQFLLDSSGNPYTSTIISLVKYSKDGQYFVIDYDSNLQTLAPNALIRLIRPKVCTGNEPTYEICGSQIDIVKPSNTAAINSIVLNAFDTYYLTRVIPVPVITIIPPVPPSTTPTTTSVNEIRILGFRFESNSPSNFWGQGVSNKGRLNVKNPYEAEILKPNEISLSGVLSPNGQISFLQTFDDALKFIFDVPINGGICYFRNEIGKVAFISQYDHYVVGFNDNLARANSDGTLQSASIVDSFGLPQRKSGDNYGCQLVDKLSISSRNGLIMWVDRSRAEVGQYNYSEFASLTKDKTIVVDGVERGKIDAYFRSKIKSMLSDPTRYFTSTVNPITNEYILTDFSLTEKGYTNVLRTYNPSVSETVLFDIYTRDVKGFPSFTPEQFAYLDGDILNVQLFAFKNGVPYNHYNLNENNSFNNFFGVQCESVIKIIENVPPFTKKKWLSIQNYCKQAKFFCDEIITESGQQSFIMLDEFNQAYYFSFAAILKDINTPMDINNSQVQQLNPRIEGDPLYGNWISVRFVCDPSMNNKYLELFGFIVEYFKQEKTG